MPRSVKLSLCRPSSASVLLCLAERLTALSSGQVLHGSFLCLVVIMCCDVNFSVILQHDKCERQWYVFFWCDMELCIVTFVFLPGSEYVEVRLYQGVVVNPLHVKNLSALYNLSTMNNEHHHFY